MVCAMNDSNSLVGLSKMWGTQKFLSSSAKQAAQATASKPARTATGDWGFAHTPAPRGRVVTATRRIADTIRGEAPGVTSSTTKTRRLRDVTAENRKAALRGQKAPAQAAKDKAAARRAWEARQDEWL